MTGRAMNVVLWILQFLLALAFLAHGWLFLAPPPDIAQQLRSVIPAALQIFIGTTEVLAAIGLTLPGIARVAPWLVPCAATGLMIVTISATIFHATRGELNSALTTTVLFVVVSFVAYMRWRVQPILSRNGARPGAAAVPPAAR
jgi:uncharacterized membrane protein YphA (DoxX/SURF4 family)